MTGLEEFLLTLAPSDAPTEIAGNAVPSPAHCVGTGKLLGAGLGTVLAEECDVRSPEVVARLTSLGCLLRASIVLDDFARDHRISLSQASPLGRWLANIRGHIIDLVGAFAPQARQLWATYHQQYVDAYFGFDPASRFDSVVRKCCPIFLPFELAPVAPHPRAESLKQTLRDYLFALQLIDDFADMEEDLLAPRNHNAFLVALPGDSVAAVLRGRRVLAAALFRYVRTNLEMLPARIASRTGQQYLNHSIAWLRDKEDRLGEFPSLGLFAGPFTRFNFGPLEASRLSAYGDARPLSGLADVRAENMHTLAPL